MVKVRGKLRPKFPPSVFSGIPKSCHSTTQSKPRETKRSLSHLRKPPKDEMSEFIKKDLIDFNDTIMKVNAEFSNLIAFNDSANCILIQSKHLEHGIPQFAMRLHSDFTYFCYSYGSPCQIESLASNSIHHCKTWSTFLEIIRFLSNKQKSHKTQILLEQSSITNRRAGQQKLYSLETTTRAFEYYATSRALYSRLREDFQLPSIRTLQRITSKVANVDEHKFLLNVFKNLPDHQKQCILIWDEMYVKSAITYHGGSIFGKSVDCPEKLARTVLAVMVKVLFGGPEFIYKAYPISNLTAQFLYKEATSIVETIESDSPNKVLAVITDGHRTNQKCFKMLNPDPNKPWFTQSSNRFILFDYVHVIKCIRNNWLTEKTKQLLFKWKDSVCVAKWSDLVELQKVENNSLVKLSKLNEVAVTPKPIERQNVDTCLRVFCDRTIAALESHPHVDQQSVAGTILFIKIIVKMWNIFNVRSPHEDTCNNNADRAVFKSPHDPRLQFLLDVAGMADEMKPLSTPRCQTFTKDTSSFVAHICKGAVDLTRYMLANGCNYVMLGWFSSDPIEKAFGKLRQGSGGAYFLTVQSVIEKIRIQTAKLFLQLNLDFPEDSTEGHFCDKCKTSLTEQECEIIDNLSTLEDKVPEETTSSLIYIAGYVQKKGGQAKENDTVFYFEKYGKYLESINRGHLIIPQDCIVQWCIFCLIFFVQLSNIKCHNFVANAFVFISNFYEFNVLPKHCRILANIFLANYSILCTPRSTKEASLKVLKLSST